MKYLIFFLCVQGAWAQNDIEDRWNNIYQQYYSQAMTDDEWSQIAGEKINETYAIQQGDTLWDISVTLFGNGYYWPKIWQLNSAITNPHIIKPGYELRFVPGTTESPPALQIAATANSPSIPSGPAVPGAAPVANADPNAPQYTTVPVIPPPTFKSRPVLMKIPKSLPYLTATKKENNFDRDGFTFDETKDKYSKPTLDLHTYIVETEPDSDGEVLQAEGNKSIASLFQNVYVSVPDGAVGKRYYSFHLGQKVTDPNSLFGSSAGIEVEVEGEMELTELVNPSRNLYKAIVKKTINPVRVGSRVKEGNIEICDATITDNFAKVSGQVIGGEFDGDRKILGLASIVYFNVGEEEGVEVGQMMRILKREKLRNPDTLVTHEEAPIGVAKIISVTPNRSTGVVLKAAMEILPGDYAGDNTFNAVSTNDIENELKTESLNMKQDQEAKSNQSDSDIDAQEDADEAADVQEDDDAVQEEIDESDEQLDEGQPADENSDSDLTEEENIDEGE